MLRGLVFTLVFCGAVFAQGIGSAADAVLAAVRDGNDTALAALAKETDPDPWRVADELCARGEFDAAKALAKASPRPELAKLPAYIAKRAGEPARPSADKLLAGVMQQGKSGDLAGALATLDALKDGGDPIARVRIGHIRGELLAALRRLKESARTFDAAGSAAEQMGWYAHASESLNLSARDYYMQADYRNCREQLARRIKIEKLRGSTKAMAGILHNMGICHRNLGNYPKALECYQESLRLDDAPLHQAKLLGSIGTVYQHQGAYAKALRAQERSLAIRKKLGAPKLIQGCLNNLGNLHDLMGDQRKALRYHERALKICEAQGWREAVGTSLGNIGASYFRLGEFRRALEYFERALAIAEQLKDRVGVAINLGNVASCHSKLDEHERALEVHARALRLKEELGNLDGAAKTLMSMGASYEMVGNIDKALECNARALALGEELGARSVIVGALRGDAKLCLKHGRDRKAVAAARRALGEIASMVQGLGQEEGATARAQFVEVSETGALAAALLEDTAELTFFLESARANTLLEAMGGRDRLRDVTVSAELAAEEQKARKAVLAARARYTQARRKRNLKAARAAKKEQGLALDALRDVTERIQREAKAAAQVIYPEAAKLDAIRGALTDGEALVLYALYEKRALALVVEKAGARIVDLGKPEPITEACDELVLDDTEEDPSATLQTIRKLVVEPLGLTPKTKRLLISPQGALSYVPFVAVIEGRDLVHVPSGSAYIALAQDRALRGKNVLALGDPVYTGKLKPLPHTRAEAQALGDHVLLGAEATPTGLRDALGKSERWRAVHLACHGLVDPERPMLSSLALTGGALSAFDVLRTKFSADLVVLSACETGKGKVVHGEGLLGFTRTFMVAGAPRVVVSLWPVEDKATGALMTKFYEQWKKGLPAAAALRKAQAYVRGQEQWRHPTYWAAWQLWGLP